MPVSKRHEGPAPPLGGQARSPRGAGLAPIEVPINTFPTIISVKSHSHLPGQAGNSGVGGSGGGIGGSRGGGGMHFGDGGGGGGGTRGMFSSPMALLTRLGPLLLALILLFAWSGAKMELNAMTATMSARVTDVDIMLQASRAEVTTERERGASEVAAIERKDAAALALAAGDKKEAEEKNAACEATMEELRSELDAVEKMKSDAEKEAAEATAAAAAGAEAEADVTVAGGAGGAATSNNNDVRILAARDALLSLGQALYSNAPAAFLPRQGSPAAVAAAAARDRAAEISCPGFTSAAGGGGGGGEYDEHDVSSLVFKDYVFRNPGRPSADEKDEGGGGSGGGGGGAGAGVGAGAGIDYSHMAMISRLPRAALWRWILVWQAANVKEGEPDQHFLCAYSDDAVAWTPPVAMPLGKQRGAIPWSPVLHLQGDNLVIFFAESATCRRPGGGLYKFNPVDPYIA
jgi:hypothetical protein